MSRFLSLPAICAVATIGFAGATESLHFDFNDSTHLGIQTGSLPAGTLIGPIQASSTPGSADFQGGLITLPGFAGPQGAFSIEARFRPRSYGNEDSRFIGDILNTATWNSDPPETINVPTQGFTFRLGGSYLYPVLPRNRYASDSEWVAAQATYSHIDRGRMSVCFGASTIARRDVADWKNVYTDRCVELGVWTYMAMVWDQKDLRIYVNGLDATDTLRLDGVGYPVRIDSVETAFVGGRKDVSWDPRRFDGDIDFVRMEDRALTQEEIHARYKDTFTPETRDSLCHGVATPSYPEAGRVCQGKIRFQIQIANHGACTDPGFVAGFLAGDSIAIELSKNPSFDSVDVQARFAKLSFELGADAMGSLAGYTGPIYWRVRLIPAATQSALSKKAVVTDSVSTAPEWSPSRPVILDMAAATALSRPKPRLVCAEKGLLVRSLAEPALFDLAGHRLPARFQQMPGEAGGAGYWRLESVPSGSGVFLAR